MPMFLDVHPMKPFTADQLNSLQNAPADEFGVTHHDILYSEEDDRIYCILNAPSAKAVHQHHQKAGISCDWVQEVSSTRL